MTVLYLEMEDQRLTQEQRQKKTRYLCALAELPCGTWISKNIFNSIYKVSAIQCMGHIQYMGHVTYRT